MTLAATPTPSGHLHDEARRGDTADGWFQSKTSCPPSNLANPKESQRAEITSFFFGQPLRSKLPLPDDYAAPLPACRAEALVRSSIRFASKRSGVARPSVNRL